MIAPLILMSPVFTVVLGVLLLGDRLDLRMIVGAAVTLIGVLIIALRPNRVTTLAGGLKLLGCVAFSALVVSVIAHTAYYWLINLAVRRTPRG